MKHYRFPIDGTPEIGARATLVGSDARHVRNVLRLKPGDSIILFDRKGAEFEARIVGFEGEAVTALILASNRPVRESPVSIVLAQAMLKEKKMDRVVRQLCEIGVSAWIPFFGARSVARPAEKKLATRTERWRKIAVEAAKQSRRLQVPRIRPAGDLESVLAAAEGFDLKIAFWEGAPVSGGWPNPGSSPDSVFLLVGPEGGFAEEEVARARDRGFVPASLGPRILRAETAAVVACALAQHRYGDLGSASSEGRP
ncbi:MAG: 16S rRNA (uracil(1498)-N(3))-methyltransferase [Desulfobacterales bacterium]|nr:16S rRNA (uracil(1498)-N(3))-methyltransferase [Desulfobacterales bacterium]